MGEEASDASGRGEGWDCVVEIVYTGRRSMVLHALKGLEFRCINFLLPTNIANIARLGIIANP